MDRAGGDLTWHIHNEDFSNCMHASQLAPLPFSGLRFSWHNGRDGVNSIQHKLDWAFGSPSSLTRWPEAHTVFLPRSIFDHCAMVMELQKGGARPRTTFRFLNFWTGKEDFIPMIT
ncbi:hypothetical protein OIU77_009732 [Salix suchowensis]|uniref:Uncharacterized protein n=1 Tax=Salix suchowensis TaxID=1278906 RepID=A0ABQ9A5X4_9ROSI|nr:hypothetical protein OIU78_016337 [Salix suchowensis]KAJ6327911.1 hypothetical protein OIU77_009732 [Salix suchowensis]